MKRASTNKQLLDAAKSGESIQLEGAIKEKVNNGINVKNGDVEISISPQVIWAILGFVGFIVAIFMGYNHIEMNPQTGKVILNKLSQ